MALAHDGQMGFEDAAYTNSGGTFTLANWNDYALGARGIDRWTNSTPSASSTFYPIFDPHGNQVSYISKVSGSSYWQAPQRSFDPWGNLRLGSAGNQPNGRYCANIGHENNDENAMVYMRARYYDQSCGRFISEDPAQSGRNWLTYCDSDPVNKVDRTGKVGEADILTGLSLLLATYFEIVTMIASATALPRALALRQLAEANTAIEIDFVSLLFRLKVSLEVEAGKQMERGNLRGAELYQSMAAGVDIASKALYFALKEQLSLAYAIVMFGDGTGVGSG